MTRAVTGRAVWPTIAELLAAGGPRLCAVAYLGKDAPDLLSSLGRGDVLVCDASPAALKSGATSPLALRALIDRKVTVRSRPHLHAKVYLSAAGAFVGSANASATSVRNHEAGVLLRSPRESAALAAYVEELATAQDATTVDEAFLELAEKLYRPPAGGGGGSHVPQARKLWFHAYDGKEAPAAVAKAAKRQRPIVDAGGMPVEAAATIDYSWGPRNAWPLQVMCVWVARDGHDEDTWQAAPPSVCIYREAVGGRSQQWLYWWRTPAAESLDWGTLRQRVLTHTGVRLELDTATRAIDAVDAVYAAFDLRQDHSAGDEQIA